MADLVITPANVVSDTGAVVESGIAGETIVAGKAVYKSTQGASNGKYMLADNNSAVAEAKVARGIAVNGASLNQPVSVHRHGRITIGGTVVPGQPYYLSETPGGIQPAADLATAGENVCLIGLAVNATQIDVNIQAPGVTI